MKSPLLFTMLLLSSGLAFAQAPKTKTDLLTEKEREAILAEGYKCNKPNKTDDEEKRCKEWRERVVRMIAETTKRNHESLLGKATD